MSEYIIDMCNSSYQSTSGLLNADVSQLREKIVRCSDCRHYKHNNFPRCDLYSIAHEVEPDGFCAWGERKN